MNRVAMSVVAVGLLLPSLSWAQAVDHNDWAKDVVAQTGFESFRFAFSNDNRRFVTALGPAYAQWKKGGAPTVSVRVFGAADGKSRSPTLRTTVERVEKVAVSDDGTLVAVGGEVGKNSKMQLELYDAVSGAPTATFRIDETTEASTSRWCGLAFDNAGKLFACARVSVPGKAETRIMTFTVPGLALQGTPTVVAGGSNGTFWQSDGRETGKVYTVGAKQSFRYVPARKDIVYLVDYCCDGGKRFEVASWDPATGQTTTHAKIAYRNEKKDSVAGLGIAERDLIYLYFEDIDVLSNDVFKDARTIATRADGQVLGDALGLNSVLAYFHEPGLMIDFSGRIRARGADGFFDLSGISKVQGKPSDIYKRSEQAVFGFEHDSQQLVRLAYLQWSVSRPLPPGYIAAGEHAVKARKLAEAGFQDVAASEIKASIAADPTYVRRLPSHILNFWMKWNTPAAEVGRWILTSIKARTPTGEDPTDAQFYMLFGLLAATNGHPAVALQAAAMVPKGYAPTEPSSQPFVPMYVAMVEAGAQAANGDLQGALGKLVQHRDALQKSRVRNWFYWYPELFAYLHAAEPRQMAYILGKKKNDLPKIPAPRAPAPFVDLNGAPVSVGISQTTPAPTPTKQAAPVAKPVGKVLD